MSVSSFDPSRVSGYGTSGQETARKMASTLKDHSLSVTYNADNQKFTIHNTSDIHKETLEKIFSETVYESWRPQVLDETDDLGNRLVQLKAINDIHTPLEQPPFKDYTIFNLKDRPVMFQLDQSNRIIQINSIIFGDEKLSDFQNFFNNCV